MSCAIVARTCGDHMEYLLGQAGPLNWSPAAHLAARFANVREATRAAMRTPSRFRAYALPITSDRLEAIPAA